MDTEKGKFYKGTLDDIEKKADELNIEYPHIFSVGEEVEVKGSRFRIKAIGTHFMRLELLPRLIIAFAPVVMMGTGALRKEK